MFRKPLQVRPSRMDPLARIPVFFTLAGKRVVLAGGSAPAAWKAELIAAAGAHLHVYAESFSPVMQAVASDPPAGEIRLHSRRWSDADLHGAAMAIGAIEEDAEGRAFFDAAKAAGVPVNVVDRPPLCDFAFGSIVNRSPLIIGISTDGAAPVFGQAIRARIEAMIPRTLKLWADAAEAWRPAIRAFELSFQGRRRFWERFTDRALADEGAGPTEAVRDDLLAFAETVDAEEHGSLIIVGAGPGDLNLLTLAAVRALQSADVVLHDDLVTSEVLSMARREARMMLVGKKGHGPSCRQDDINRLIVDLASGGARVVRLKSGDPLVFGRAGEEIEACRAAGVPVEIIPGISAAQAAAADLGISLTYRVEARRVQYVTGHDHNGALPDSLCWKALADPAATTAVYMPLKTLPEMTAGLLAEGLRPDTPAAAIVGASRPDRRVTIGTLGTITADLEGEGRSGPALVLIGRAIGFSTALRDSRADGLVRAAQ